VNAFEILQASAVHRSGGITTMPTPAAATALSYHGTMLRLEIKMSTTDNIPDEHYVINRSEVAWVSGSTLKEAYFKLKEWAEQNEYDAVVGLRFVAVPHDNTDETHANAEWTAYGTCIGYQDN
jgi:hypothetical protein